MLCATSTVDERVSRTDAPLPDDAALPELPRLFQNEWVWNAFCGRFGTPAEIPENIRLSELLYWPGSRAVATYVAEQQWDRWMLEDQFSIELTPGAEAQVFRYPDDPYLPGLASIASATTAQDVLPRYVPLHPQRLYVEVVRYRPTSRAVLRHTVSWRRSDVQPLTLFVRAVPPERVPAFVAAGELAERSGFSLPRLAGHWAEGGVLWLASVPGDTVRSLIRDGGAPEPGRILDGIAPLWASPPPDSTSRAPDLSLYLRATDGLLRQVLEDEEARLTLRDAMVPLRRFVEAWKPSSLAHNDFYDDQLLLTPEDRLVLADFEEVGPGDPLLDIGNFLAHLRWMARFGIAPDECDAYRRELRDMALERFRWDRSELALREAFALLRLSSNPVRRLRADWDRDVKTGLALTAEVLDGAD